MKICSTCKIEKPFINFSKDKDKKYGLRGICRDCDGIRKEKNRSTEKGFFIALYGNMISKQKSKNKGIYRGKVHDVYFTFEELMEMWEKHKLKYGQNCIYTNEPIFHKRDKNNIRGNQISIDRLDNNKPYTTDNIVFCSSKANWIKGQVTINMCKKILNLYNETQS